MDSDGERYFRQLFGPAVGLLCSTDSDEVVSRNGLSITEFFQPFSCVNAELTSRDPNGQLHGLSNFTLNFRNIRNEPIPEEKLKAKLDEILQNSSKEIRREQHRFENETYNLNINAACPWYQKYRDTYLAHSLIYPHERIRHVISSILVVSSENGDPMAEFRNLAEVHRQRQLESQKATEYNHIDPAQNYWFSESTNICFLLLHDIQKGSEAKAQEVFANLKQTFGAAKAFILRVNTGGNNGEAPDPWGQFSENQKMRLCDGKDQDSIRSFIKDLSTGAIVPHLEHESKKLYEIIQNRRAIHRSLFSATKKLFGGSSSKSSVQEKFMEPVEIQLRRFGDLCFMLQLYETAAQYYSTAKRDLSNEQNWVEATSASEFAATAQFMAGGNLRASFPKQAAAFAINSFLNLEKKDLALRSAFTTLEAGKSVGAWIDTAKDYLRFSKGFNSNQIAMFTEQAALCYLKAGHPRQFGFQSVLAGFQYKLSGIRTLALRNYKNAVDVYEGRGWDAAELHGHEVAGELSQFLGQSVESERSYAAALSLGCGQNAAVFTNYLAMVQYNQQYKGQKVMLPFPKIDGRKIGVVLERFSNQQTEEGESLRSEVLRMRKLEEMCVKAANDGIAPITFKTSIPSERRNVSTFNEKPMRISKTDRVLITVPIENTLNNSLLLTDIKLIGEGDFISEFQEKEIIIDPKLTSTVTFRIVPGENCDALEIKSISYKITTADAEGTAVVETSQDIHISGERLNKLQKHRKGVFYADDKRLSFIVEKEMPLLNMSVESVPDKLICGEIFETTITFTNSGAKDAENCWLNHNQNRLLKILDGQTSYDPSTIALSSYPSLVSLGDIPANSSKTLSFFLKAPESQQLNSLDIVLYSNGSQDRGTKDSLSVTMSNNIEVIGMISPAIHVLPAPIGAKKRVLQIHLDTASENFTASCRFTTIGLALISNQWTLSDTKQPCAGISWMQGQRSSFLCFVDEQSAPIETSVSESVDGRRAYRRHMKKKVYFTETGAELARQFLSESVKYNVPEPIPEDDVIQHYWLENFANERISIILQWSAELMLSEGSRQCLGQSSIHLDDIFAFANQEQTSPVAAPVRAYLDAPSRVEHDFSSGPAKIRCKIIIENSYKDKSVDVKMCFSHFDCTSGVNNNISYAWVGYSEKKLTVKSQKTTDIKNEVLFTTPGTYDLSKITVTVDGLEPLTIAQHIIVVSSVR